VTEERVKSSVARATGKALVAITVSNECRVDIPPSIGTVLKKRREGRQVGGWGGIRVGRSIRLI
jgi:hypothetical protein